MALTNKIEMVRPEFSFRGSNHHPYYIWAEDYKQQSSGSRVTYILCHVLNEMGFEAYVTSSSTIPHFRTPQITFDIRNKHQAEGRRPIAVYTEIVEGNPLDGEVVVRWVNNRVGNVGMPVEFHENDLIYYYSSVFAPDDIAVDMDNLLAVAGITNESIFNTNNVIEDERHGFCYYAHKYLRDGNGTVADKLKSNGTSLCQDIPRTHIEIASLLKKSKVLYSYDIGAITREAYMCGCPVVLVGTDYLYNQYAVAERSLLNDWHYIQKEQDIDIAVIPEEAKVRHGIYLARYKNKAFFYWETVNNFVIKTQMRAQCSFAGSTDYGSQEVRHFCTTHEHIYIYGGGSIARNCYNVLTSLGIQNIKGFVVSDGAKANVEIFDKPVYEFLKLPCSPQECGIILAMRMCFREEVIPSIVAGGYDYMHYCVKPR